MDLFLEGCQGLGLALAAGALAGALAGVAGAERAVRLALGALAAIGGAALFGLSLTEADHPAWPGWPVGAALALGAFAVAGGVVGGARRRVEGEGSAAALAGMVVLAALLLAALALLVSPVSLLAFGALVWLAVGRRRRAQRKYEGLRVLR